MSLEQEGRRFVSRWLRAGMVDAVVDRLSQFPLLAGLTAREIEIFASYLEPREIPAGINLFLAGDKGVTLFLLESGTVDVLKVLPGGTEQRLTTLTDRGFLGEIALLSDVTRTATARSTSPCHMWLLYRDDFQRLCQGVPEIGVKILWALAAEMGLRLARTNEMVGHLLMDNRSAARSG